MQLRPSYKNLLTTVLAGIAHGSVHVEEQWTGLRSCALIATCHKNEQGILMGANAKNIKALQKIFKAIGNNRQDRVSITLNGAGEPTGKVNGYKDWSPDEASNLFHELIQETGVDPIHWRLEPVRGGTGIVCHPNPPGQLGEALNTVMEAYGKSHNHNFGLVDENMVTV